MQTGKLGKSYFAAAFVEVPKFVHEKDGKPLVPPEMVFVSRKHEMVFWSVRGVEDAKSGLTAAIEDKGYRIDESRTSTETTRAASMAENEKKDK